MINTRLSIFKTLEKLFKRLTKQADLNPEGFKTVLYAVILNDVKEWSEYFPDENYKKIVTILNDYILCNKIFMIDRFIDSPDLYVNTNTPQDNTTWREIKNKKTLIPTVHENLSWEIDPSCYPEIVYWPGDPREGEYKIDITKLTTCQKMNIYIDRVTGQAWYLTCEGAWKPVVDTQGLSVDAIIEIVKQHRGEVQVNENASDIEWLLEDKATNSKVNLATTNDINNLL